MELRHLRYFTAVVQWKGYREASRHSYVAQPSISEAVSDLEGELGIKLFSREGRAARLTPEGQIFYEEAIKTLTQAERSIATAQRNIRLGIQGSRCVWKKMSPVGRILRSTGEKSTLDLRVRLPPIEARSMNRVCYFANR
jgi:DNA-binding transcriptional LysR family regulator